MNVSNAKHHSITEATMGVSINFNKETAQILGGQGHLRVEMRDGALVVRPTKRLRVRACSDSVMGTISYKDTGAASVKLGTLKVNKLAERGCTQLLAGTRWTLVPLTYTWFRLEPYDANSALKISISKG